MADITRPKTKFGSRPESRNDSVVDGFSVTPVEGHDTANVPRLPQDPDEVLALLKARLALGDAELEQLNQITSAQHYQSALAKTSTWPPKEQSPSSPDITPAPVVIGVGEIEAMAAAAQGDATRETTTDDQRDTPAEPVASVRVKQVSSRSPAPEQPQETRNPNLARHLGSIAGMLYFPPMKPPESWQQARSDEPLVEVVPDCDAKTRTAKSLRRNSNWPHPSYLSDLRARPSVLLVSTVAVTLVLGAALLSAPWKQQPFSAGSTPSMAKPRATASTPTTAPSVDAGLASPMRAAGPEPSATSKPARPAPLASGPGQATKAKGTNSARAPKTLAPSSDGLVF